MSIRYGKIQIVKPVWSQFKGEVAVLKHSKKLTK